MTQRAAPAPEAGSRLVFNFARYELLAILLIIAGEGCSPLSPTLLEPSSKRSTSSQLTLSWRRCTASKCSSSKQRFDLAFVVVSSNLRKCRLFLVSYCLDEERAPYLGPRRYPCISWWRFTKDVHPDYYDRYTPKAEPPRPWVHWDPPIDLPHSD